MKKRIVAGIVGGLLAASFFTYTTLEKSEARDAYSTYVKETYQEQPDIELSRDWKMGGYVGEVTLTKEPFAGTYFLETYGDGSIHDNVLETYWEREAERTIHERLVSEEILKEEETVRAEVPTGVSDDAQANVTTTPTSIYETNPETYLDVSIMFHEDWNNTDEQKQRILNVMRDIEPDVYSIHFSFDGKPGGNDDYTERYMMFTRAASDIDPSFLDVRTIEDLNEYDRLYGFDETTFMTEYHFDGTPIEDETTR
ncbi:hypothetical protein [Exiguobacterium aestuarii]|jgi:hypothetical protein|uniref:hypothetical protein n=1 Tax=Exiguobacterium aestuarii TaxID=273527 RepID=UPI001CD72797|nr:hypothetical protein [Exiguobacterium aestuarii]MCA0979653.1 hypothetical protein [Exiguobacterium aestuarii]